MIRSVFAIIAATLIGLTASRFVEGAGQAAGGAAPGGGVYQWSLALGWTLGAFAAALTALLIGRRWAPLGVLAAATIFFAAAIAQLSYSLSWFLWPASAAGTALGGYAAMRLLNARNVHPSRDGKKEFFDD